LELGPDHVALVQALGLLDADQRVVVVLHHLADREIADIAHELRLPVGTVKSRLARGRARLSELLGEEVDRHA
jgi:RNA polymerase sigma-70 factor (ECF subfamily)